MFFIFLCFFSISVGIKSEEGKEEQQLGSEEVRSKAKYIFCCFIYFVPQGEPEEEGYRHCQRGVRGPERPPIVGQPAQQSGRYKNTSILKGK